VRILSALHHLLLHRYAGGVRDGGIGARLSLAGTTRRRPAPATDSGAQPRPVSGRRRHARAHAHLAKILLPVRLDLAPTDSGTAELLARPGAFSPISPAR